MGNRHMRDYLFNSRLLPYFVQYSFDTDIKPSCSRRRSPLSTGTAPDNLTSVTESLHLSKTDLTAAKGNLPRLPPVSSSVPVLRATRLFPPATLIFWARCRYNPGDYVSTSRSLVAAEVAMPSFVDNCTILFSLPTTTATTASRPPLPDDA